MQFKPLLILALYCTMSGTVCGQTKTGNIPDSLKNPATLNQAIAYLNITFSDSLKQASVQMTENEFTGNYHFGLGMSIRNSWGLWKGSPLSRHFNTLGIGHPDDMSAIILTSFYRNLKGADIDLHGQVKYYQSYWKAQAAPLPKDYPEGIKKLSFTTLYNYTTKDSLPAAIHLAETPRRKEYWLYDSNRGWKKLSRELVNELNQATDRREWVEALFK